MGGIRVYLSGPMTGYEDFNFPAFNYATKMLEEVGFVVENPADKGIIEGWTWADYLKYDIAALITCEKVALLPGWECSRGARFEVLVADTLGITTLPWRNLIGDVRGMV